MMLVVTKCQNDMSIYRLSIVGRGLVSVSYKICNYTKQGTRMRTGIIWPKVGTCGWIF